MMDKNVYRIHYIEDESQVIAYLPDSLRFFKITPLMKEILNDICSGIQRETVIQKYNMKEEFYEKLVGLFEEKVEVTNEDEGTLEKFTLNISSGCNLACKYCYANEGKYENCVHNMTKETAKRAIDLFTSRYHAIKMVMFFGGEPTLNLDTMEFACDYFQQKVDEGVLDYLPVLGMVTNGTNASERFLSMVNKYKLNITVSLDGEKDVNDSTRVYRNGEGTYEDVVANIKRLQEQCNQPTTIEATYHKIHVDNNISVVDVVRHCKDDLGVPIVHIAAVSANNNDQIEQIELNDKDSFLDAIEEVFMYRKEGKDYSYLSLNKIFQNLNNRPVHTRFCEAGIRKFAVSSEGEVYPCQVLTDKSTVYLGNVYDEHFFESEQYIKITSMFKNFNKFEVEKCKNCFYNTMCQQCIGENYLATKDYYNVPKETCEFSKKRVESVIKHFASADSV